MDKICICSLQEYVAANSQSNSPEYLKLIIHKVVMGDYYKAMREWKQSYENAQNEMNDELEKWKRGAYSGRESIRVFIYESYGRNVWEDREYYISRQTSYMLKEQVYIVQNKVVSNSGHNSIVSLTAGFSKIEDLLRKTNLITNKNPIMTIYNLPR